VISWGESTFIPNGINVINPVDSRAAHPRLRDRGSLPADHGPVGQPGTHQEREPRGLLPRTTTRSASTRAARISRTTTSPRTTRIA
jgi:hypothetical protein